MRIAHNIPALQASTALGRANKKVAASSQRMASGVRINSAKDDAAGLAVARKLKLQIDGLERASKNATDGISLVQTAEGALTEINNMIQRMRELAVQAANGTLESADRTKIQTEIEGLIQEISDVTDRTEFNKVKVLNGQAARLGFSSNVKIADVSYVSDTMPPGTLDYTLERVGLPAQIELWGTFADPITEDGTITLNGEAIEVSAGDTFSVIAGKLQKVGEVIGANVALDNGSIYITTKEAGSNQSLKLEFSTDLQSEFVSYPSDNEQGTDAVISGVTFTDQNGNVDTGFKATLTTQINGNRIVIGASNGRKVALDIPLEVDPTSSPPFTLNGFPIAWPGLGDIPDVRMTAQIMDYGPLALQIGPDKGMEMEIIIPELSSESLGLLNLNYQTIETATQALKKLDTALADVVRVRSKLGAYQNRLEYTVLSLDASKEAAETSRSRIEDTDMAKETTAYTLQNVLSQAGISILAQANQRPQQVLSLMN